MTAQKVALACALVLLAVCVPAVGAAGGNSVAPDNSTQTGPYTLAELREDGRHYDTPSWRIVPEQHRLYWLEHRDTSKPWTSVSKTSPGVKLEAGSLVEANTAYLRTILATESPEQQDVTLVYWQEGEIQQGNETVPAAVNQRVVERTVTLEPGQSLAGIDLPQHDETHQVTMWLDSAPEKARWTFEHKSTATSQPADIDTQGEYFTRAGAEFMLPVILGMFVSAYTLREWLDEAGIGPMYGYGAWIVMITIFSALFVVAAFDSMATALVNLPYLMAGYVVLIFSAIMLETYQKDVGKALFYRAELTEGESFNGDEAFAMGNFLGDMEEERILKTGDGLPSVVRPGLFAFLARVFGARAYLEGAEEMKSRIKLPSSEWDELYLVDPEADSVVDYTPEGWRLALPSFESVGDVVSALVKIGLAGAVGYGAANVVGVGWVQYVLPVGVLAAHFAEARGGSASFDPAPAHMREVFASNFIKTAGYSDAKTLDETKEALMRERLKRQQDVEDELADMDQTLIEELLGDDSRSVEDVLRRDDAEESPTSVTEERDPREEVDTLADD